MEDSEFEDVLDDWFIESLKTYKDLHVYQLEHPSQVIEWTSGKTVCVAGYRPGRNELLELRLPMKLFAEENKGLCAERDFQVTNGGFTDGPVCSLRHIPETRLIVTNDGLSSDLQLWELGGGDSDVIRRTGKIKGRRGGSEPGSKLAATVSSSPQVLHGAESSGVHLTELTSGQTLYELETDSADPLTSLQFISGTVFLASCSNGTVYQADVREAAPSRVLAPPSSSALSTLWWADACVGAQQPSFRLLRLSSSGHAVVSDLRSPAAAAAVCQARLSLQSDQCRPAGVRVSWAPAGSHISVSGFGGAVEIYDPCGWGTELRPAQPLFQHRGHAVSCQQDAGSAPVCVTSHTWHPERPQTLLSTASDASFHVWDWVEPDTKRKSGL